MVENGVTITYDGSEALLKAIKVLTDTVVMVGIPDSSTRSEGGPSNAELAYIHEFGSPIKNIPARPFLIPAINDFQAKAEALLTKSASLQMDGKPAEAQEALQAMGQAGADAVRAKIVSGPFAPLQAATIAARQRRGSRGTKPLIDTTQMLKAVTWAVRKRGG